MPAAALALTACGLVMGAALGLGYDVQTASAAPTPNDPPLLQLSTDPPGTVHELAPGVPALWRIGVTTRVQRLDSLVGYLRAHGALSSLGPQTTVALASCTEPWTAGGCPAGAHSILAATAIDGLTQSAAPLTDPAKRIPAHVYLQASILLDAGAPATVQGSTVTVVATVTASGTTDRVAANAPGGLGPNGIAHTGTDLLAAALLGAAAVAAGATIAGSARRRRSGHAPR